MTATGFKPTTPQLNSIHLQWFLLLLENVSQITFVITKIVPNNSRYYQVIHAKQFLIQTMYSFQMRFNLGI